jgi:hypothetical protein
MVIITTTIAMTAGATIIAATTTTAGIGSTAIGATAITAATAIADPIVENENPLRAKARGDFFMF